jgi:hypothetical protein
LLLSHVMHFLRAGLTALVLSAFAPQARAQTPAPGYAPPPAGYVPPPAGYAPPPAGYAPQPGYAYAPPIGAFSPVRLGPPTLPFEEGYSIPPGYHQEMRTRKGLVVGGAVTFGVLYSLSATGVLLSGGGAKAVLVPVAGPFIEIGNLQRTLSGSEASGLRAMATTFLVLDGVGQAAGVAMLLVGLTQPAPLLVRNDVTGATLRITPLSMGYDGREVGIGIVGTM